MIDSLPPYSPDKLQQGRVKAENQYQVSLQGGDTGNSTGEIRTAMANNAAGLGESRVQFQADIQDQQYNLKALKEQSNLGSIAEA